MTIINEGANQLNGVGRIADLENAFLEVLVCMCELNSGFGGMCRK